MATLSERDGVARPDCVRAQGTLERQALELPVGLDEERWLAEHGRTCESCRAFAAALALLGDAEAQPAAMDAASVAALVTAFHARRSRRWMGRALAVAAGLAVVVSASLMWRTRRSPPEVTASSSAQLVRGALADAHERVPLHRRLRPNVAYAAGPGGATVADEGSRFHLEADAAASFAREDRTHVVTLTSGRLAASVTLAPGEAVEVRTGDCRVVVRGTVFAVEAGANATRVEVAKGAVEVARARGRGAGADRTIRVAANEAVLSSTMEPTPLAAERRAMLFDELGLTDSPAPRSPLVGPAPRVRDEARDGRERGRRAREAVANRAAPAPTLDAMLGRARACLVERDYACAADGYRSILTRWPDSPESTNANVALGDLELRHLGRARDALEHFEVYLERKPGGTLELEALSGKAAALERLGLAAREREALRLLVGRYPLSEQARAASERLRALERK